MAQPVPQLCPERATSRAAAAKQLIATQHGERDEHGKVADTIERESPTGPGSDDDAADARSDDARRVEDRGVQSNGALHVLAWDELTGERLPRGRLERGEQSQQQRQDIYLPELDVSAEGDRARPSACSADSVLVIMISRCLPTRSAITPATRDSNSAGVN